MIAVLTSPTCSTRCIQLHSSSGRQNRDTLLNVGACTASLPSADENRSISSSLQPLSILDPKSDKEGCYCKRRQLFYPVLLCYASVCLSGWPRKLAAEEIKKDEPVKDGGVLGGIISIFDPNETTKSGNQLPKAYVKSAREVVKSLRESFSQDSNDDAKFRRNADTAKTAIRDYISNWRGDNVVMADDSYQALERALRVLGEFYSKKGPRAALPDSIQVVVLEDLQKVDDAL